MKLASELKVRINDARATDGTRRVNLILGGVGACPHSGFFFDASNIFASLRSAISCLHPFAFGSRLSLVLFFLFFLRRTKRKERKYSYPKILHAALVP